MKIRSRAINIVLSRLGAWVLKLLFSTVKADIRCAVPAASPYCNPEGSTRYAFCMWHDGIVIAVYSHKTYSLSGLISQHRDGGYLADAAEYSGIYPVRGSASRGGAEAVRQLIELSHLHVALTPDGPRGPRRRLKEGILYLASRSRRPIVPTAIAGTSCWSIKGNWTDLLLPKPFSRALLLAGQPIVLPEDLPREQFAEYLDLLQAEMERMDQLAVRILAGDESATAELGQRVLFPHEVAENTTAAKKAA